MKPESKMCGHQCGHAFGWISVGTARPRSVEAIARIRPHLVVVVSFVQADFTASAHWRWQAR